MENCPQPQTNLKSNPNPNWGTTFLEGNGLVAPPPNPKTNADLDPNTNPNRGAIFLRGAIVRIT